MNIQKIINKNRKLTNILLKYIGDENQSIDEYEQLRSFLDQNQIQQNYEKLRELLHIILNISNNHHRNINFFNKIEQIFKFLGNNIKQTFSNSEIYDFFSSNNSILLLLIKNSIIIIDESISALIQEENSNEKNFYFFPEIKPFINHSKSDEIEKEMQKSFPNIEDFFRLREKGENEHYICELIRNDSIEEFVKYVNQTNYSISSTIQHSIFETNAFLVERKNTTLIEYAAFFGSIQIFQYLKLNGIELTTSLWLYSIHSKNAELIHILEENNVKLPSTYYTKCLEESIKCHHNDFANYFLNNYLNEDEVKSHIEKKFECNIVAYCFHYHNFMFLEEEFFNYKFTFFYCCNYDYIDFVKFYINTKKIDINSKAILFLQ